jgi:RNA polymerase sigma-70 factor (ECF subfamily)
MAQPKNQFPVPVRGAVQLPRGGDSVQGVRFLPFDRRKPALEQLAAACCDLVRRGRESWRDDAADVAQDACVHVLRLTTPQTVREPARYLARIARNLLIDRRRYRKREAAVFDSSADAELAGRHSLDPERIASGEQVLVLALAVIEALPPRCRQAFELHRFEGLNYVGIAHRMGISTSMVEKHIAEAMLRLTREIGSAHAAKSTSRRSGPNNASRTSATATMPHTRVNAKE